MKKIFTLPIIALCLVSGAVHGQEKTSDVFSRDYIPADKASTFITPGKSVLITRYKGREISRKTLSRQAKTSDTTSKNSKANNIVSVIIQFTDVPTALRENEGILGMNSFRQGSQNSLDQFKSDLRSIHTLAAKNARTGTPVASPKIKQEYSMVFSGVSIEVDRSLLSEIKKLPYVKSITENKQLEFYVEKAATIVKADTVRIDYGIQGEDMVVAIIDSGIDYNHPDLGGGFGAGFKVIGGYDFGEEDNDPVDVLGHGTHVAGIVAADGVIKGIAPKASLLAYKVTFDGVIEPEWVIAAIERCADPNQDGDFSDRPDVVNISLGGPGHADDPMSQAVDNLVSLGITVCVAAGNSGAGYIGYNGLFSIDSPSAARTAITVGASDNDDKIADFSSKGPVSLTGQMKPEVVAPGVDILSTFLDNKYESISGTSMSSPLVAGVCALLKQLHPSWTPAQIKSALMTTADDIGEAVMIQGAGRVNALEAAKSDVFISPANLSFGFVDYSGDTWTTTQTITLENNTGTAIDYSVQLDQVPFGAEITASPSSFSIPNGASQEVIMSLEVDNFLLPIADSTTIGFLYGNTFFTDAEGANTVEIPWSFSNVAQLVIKVDLPPSNGEDVAFQIFNDNYNVINGFVRIDSFTYIKNIYAGTYELLAQAVTGDGFLEEIKFFFNITEDLQINGTDTLDISFIANSTRELKIDFVDENGDSPFKNFMGVNYFEMPYGVDFTLGAAASETFPAVSSFINNLSERYTISMSRAMNQLGLEGNKIYLPTVSFKGIHPDVAFPQNDPDVYIKHDFSVYSSADYSTHFGGIIANFFSTDSRRRLLGSLSEVVVMEVDANNEWHGTMYMTPNNQDAFSVIEIYGHNTYELGGGGGFGGFEPLVIPTVDAAVISPYFVDDNGSLTSVVLFDTRDSKMSNKSESGIKINHGLSHYDGFLLGNLFANNSIALPSETKYISNLNGERPNATNLAMFNLYDENDNLVHTSPIVPKSEEDEIPFKENLTPGKYRGEVIDTTLFVNGIKSIGKWNATVDINNTTDAVSPGISMLRLVDVNGHSTNKFQTAEPTTLMFAVEDFTNANGGSYNTNVTPTFHYRQSGETGWKEVSITHITEQYNDPSGSLNLGHVYMANLEEMTDYDSVLMDIKIVVLDNAGNKLEWTQEPAFIAVDNLITALEKNGRTNQPSFGSVYPNPFSNTTEITFSIPESEDVRVTMYNVMGKEINVLANKPMKEGNHTIKWNGADARGHSLENGVYIYKLQVGNNFTHSGRVLLIR